MSDAQLRETVREYLDRFDDGALPIVQAGHPVLRAPAAPYSGQLGDLLPRLIEVMRTTMRAAPGVGLAAPQIGIGLAIAVIEDPGMGADGNAIADARERAPLPFEVLLNPEYEPAGPDRCSFYEGCLSVSGFQGVVSRLRSVRLRAQDENGAPIDRVVTGWPARIVQHETDHLRGQLYIDHAETRSLSSTDNYGRFWAHEAVPQDAARTLGFALDLPVHL